MHLPLLVVAERGGGGWLNKRKKLYYSLRVITKFARCINDIDRFPLAKEGGGGWRKNLSVFQKERDQNTSPNKMIVCLNV
jgi:hypothetical protein